MFIYAVRPGDSVYSLSRLFHVGVQKISADNQLADPGTLVVGQALAISADSAAHTVVPGETLSGIAALYQVPVSVILKANSQITNPQMIRAGQVVTIPSQITLLGKKQVNGYGFPGISEDTLERTAPGLTYCSVFSYQAGADGSLNKIDDNRVIRTSRRNGVAPMMVVTNIAPDKGFSSDLAHSILSDESVQNNLIGNILNVLKNRNYYGLNIDFEYVYPQDRQNYNSFVAKTAAKLHENGYILTTSLAPKTSASQQGLLYEAHDYPAHGAAVDHVILMTYEWGYTYGPARPVAPLNLVEQVVRYAVSVIPNEKILMGIPNYGYDWTLPFVRGSSARSLTNPGAVELAARVGARILYDEEAQSPHFSYYDTGGRKHEVWYEDARSINAKLQFADLYGLGGVSYWTINSYFSQNWLILHSLYQVLKVL